MKFTRVIATLVSLSVLLMALAACGTAKTESTTTSGSGGPETGSTVGTTDANGMPIYPGAKPLDANDPMAMAVNLMKDQMKQTEGAGAVIDAYVLPADASFAKVKEFYNAELTKLGWKTVPEANAANPNAAVWLKDTADTFTVTSVPGQSANIIMVIFAGTK
jgi:hypothetical protein